MVWYLLFDQVGHSMKAFNVVSRPVLFGGHARRLLFACTMLYRRNADNSHPDLSIVLMLSCDRALLACR